MTMPSPWPTLTKLMVTLPPLLVVVAVCVILGFGFGVLLGA